ncbi:MULTISPECIES: heme-binding protein [unclassified Oceanobacter]|uniref:GlcG/HbpS family heme-binding protein n=1 Tax=unclassified Oceanobacter TaxID=2620260 RepID=UPI0027330A09|nr:MULTISPECIES: heme-binding protein [unclassified Oceanobacter]MDP2548803.1 heme-binding protein [Oceanobacter sp. 4_MG-2023]MDP2609228.1 heme-binding protein [Oceanobacter sp. 1_MG-2023]MDP2612480.1 heme-binding protein [Oceanobacter sp. 2_MG-2023]
MNPINCQQARQMLDDAVKQAEDMGLNVCISVVDSGANQVAFLRMDKAFLGSTEVSQRKARTAVLFQCPTDVFGQVIEQEKLLGMDQIDGGLMAFGGGLPILVNGELIGAVGVSGATAKQDKAIATTAITALLAQLAS